MLKEIEHFSFTVSDIEKALHFFRDLLGMSATPVEYVCNEGVQQIIGIPGASLRISIVRAPAGGSIELIEYVTPKGRRIDLRTNNYGVGHVAFLVQDLKKMYETLTANGVRFISQPVWLKSNDGQADWGVCYLKGPDDITIELIESAG